MGRGHLQNSDVNRSHEPIGIPLNRPPGTFSPTGGEGQDEGVRFIGRLAQDALKPDTFDGKFLARVVRNRADFGGLMIAFLRKLLSLAGPYGLRLALGILFGILGGFVEPLLVILIPLVGRVIFPGAEPTAAQEVTKNLPRMLRPMADSLTSWFAHSESSHVAVVKVLVVSLIPLVVLLPGVLGLFNAYFRHSVAVRA